MDQKIFLQNYDSDWSMAMVTMWGLSESVRRKMNKQKRCLRWIDTITPTIQDDNWYHIISEEFSEPTELYHEMWQGQLSFVTAIQSA